VKGLAKGVEVTEGYREDRRGEFPYYAYRIDSPQLRTLADALHRATGLGVSSFHASYRAKADEPVVVDRVQDDPRLAADWPIPTPLADLPKLTFQAHHYVAGGHRFDAQVSYGEHTVAGAKPASLKPLPKDTRRLTYDPAGKKYYGIVRSEIAEI